VEGIREPIPLTGGDCFLLARDTSIVMRDSPRTRPRSTFREIAAKANNNVAHYGGGGAPTIIVCGSLSFERASLKPITQLLPRFILIKADQAHTLALHNTMQALASEMAEQAPGSEVVTTRLAEVLFIQALRAHIASEVEWRNKRMASCNFRSSSRRCPECRSRQCEYTLDSRIPGRSGDHVSLRIRSPF
jgi:Cupin